MVCVSACCVGAASDKVSTCASAGENLAANDCTAVSAASPTSTTSALSREPLTASKSAGASASICATTLAPAPPTPMTCTPYGSESASATRCTPRRRASSLRCWSLASVLPMAGVGRPRIKSIPAVTAMEKLPAQKKSPSRVDKPGMSLVALIAAGAAAGASVFLQTLGLGSPQIALLWKLFATCASVKIFSLEIFRHSPARRSALRCSRPDRPACALWASGGR